ncbi:MAG TPA: hypothetical protein VK550_00715 [Polyangiaceae bacterium]|nr:hypothetical protein [Polyangiaceae bacterium]
MWTRLDFGRHFGKTLPQVIFSDPGWVFWACANGCFESRRLLEEAEQVDYRARHVRVSGNDTGRMVLYTTDAGKFAGITLVLPTIVAECGSAAFLCNHFDLSFPSRLAKYDKLGEKLMIRGLKECLFHNPTLKMSEARATAFFDDDSNFCLQEDCPACSLATATGIECERACRMPPLVRRSSL